MKTVLHFASKRYIYGTKKKLLTYCLNPHMVSKAHFYWCYIEGIKPSWPQSTGLPGKRPLPANARYQISWSISYATFISTSWGQTSFPCCGLRHSGWLPDADWPKSQLLDWWVKWEPIMCLTPALTWPKQPLHQVAASQADFVHHFFFPT